MKKASMASELSNRSSRVASAMHESQYIFLHVLVSFHGFGEPSTRFDGRHRGIAWVGGKRGFILRLMHRNVWVCFFFSMINAKVEKGECLNVQDIFFIPGALSFRSHKGSHYPIMGSPQHALVEDIDSQESHMMIRLICDGH
jgi:hypothetical protein